MNIFSSSKKADFSKAAFLLITIIGVVVACNFAERYIVTFIIALIVWFIIHELRENIQMVPYFKKHMPMWLQSLIAFLVMCGVVFVVLELLMVNIIDLMEKSDTYEANLTKALTNLSERVGLDLLSQVNGFTENFRLADNISVMIETASAVLDEAFMVLLYVLFLLIEESIFPQKLYALYDNKKRKVDSTQKLFQKMDKHISKYLSLKALVSALTGVLSYFVLLLLGLDAPVFWALIIFVLNFIPTIGSLVATAFPAIFAILQFGDVRVAIYVVVIVGFIQVVIGNIVEPKLMGNSLNLSPLVVVLALTIWGAIWGIMGMILSVPITVMMLVVFEEIPSMRPVAILLSEKGNINFLDEDPDED